jgi:hypothetical protein
MSTAPILAEERDAGWAGISSWGRRLRSGSEETVVRVAHVLGWPEGTTFGRMIGYFVDDSLDVEFVDAPD